MKDVFVKTANHGRIHVLEEGQGPALLLLHSNGNSAYEYEELMNCLAGRFKTVAIDFPGHGDSDPLPRHYGVNDYADAVIECLNCLGFSKAGVLGSSIGGAVCVDLGVRYPQRIERLFIVEAPVRTSEEWRQRWLATEYSYSQVTQGEEQVRPRLRRLTPEILQRWNIDRNKAGAWTMTDVMWALREFDILSSIPKVDASTTVIYGSKTPHPHALGVFERELPSARRVQMPDCGHFPMLDDPERLAEEIAASYAN